MVVRQALELQCEQRSIKLSSYEVRSKTGDLILSLDSTLDQIPHRIAVLHPIPPTAAPPTTPPPPASAAAVTIPTIPINSNFVQSSSSASVKSSHRRKIEEQISDADGYSSFWLYCNNEKRGEYVLFLHAVSFFFAFTYIDAWTKVLNFEKEAHGKREVANLIISNFIKRNSPLRVDLPPHITLPIIDSLEQQQQQDIALDIFTPAKVNKQMIATRDVGLTVVRE